jgi:integrase
MAGRATKINMTDRWLQALRKKRHPPEPRLVFFYDGTCPGLNLLWTPTALSWGMTKRWPGKDGDGKNPTWRSLGAVYIPPKPPKDEEAPKPEEEKPEDQMTGGALTLAEARAKARRWLDQLSRGIDPVAEAKRSKAERQLRYTFAQVRAEHIEHHWKRNGLAKAGEAERLLKREFSDLDDLFADEITDQDVDKAIQAIIARNAPSQARNALGYLRGLYTWLMANPRYGIKASPVTGLRPAKLIGEKKSRDRWLRDAELRAVWNTADAFGPAASAIRLLILTAKRLNEIVRLSWKEIDLDKGEIIIPGRRMKGKNAPDHLVPITLEMAKILRALPRWNRGDFVFSTTGGKLPMTVGSKIKNKLDAIVGFDDWVWHDLRRTARTNFSKLAIAEPVREALLAHVKKGMEKTYDIHDFAQEKRDGLMLWESALMRIVNPSPATVTNLGEELVARRGAA